MFDDAGSFRGATRAEGDRCGISHRNRSPSYFSRLVVSFLLLLDAKVRLQAFPIRPMISPNQAAARFPTRPSPPPDDFGMSRRSTAQLVWDNDGEKTSPPRLRRSSLPPSRRTPSIVFGTSAPPSTASTAEGAVEPVNANDAATSPSVPEDYKGDYLLTNDATDDYPATVNEMGSEEMLREWFPLSFEAYLDPSIPNPVLHMGRNLVVWKTGEDPVDGGAKWAAMDDMCPHKLAPLSDGSIVTEGGGGAGVNGEDCGDSRLRCSYHGWQFDRCGTCAMIPAQPLGAKMPFPPRCNVRSYPVRRTGNMLWIWMDPSVEPTSDEENPRFRHKCWELANGYQRELAYSWDYLFENILDPTHVAYSHFGVGKVFNRTEVDEIRDDHVTNLKAAVSDAGVQLRFNRTVNGNNMNETWDFMYPGVWFLRRGGSDKGPGGVIMASPIDPHRTRMMTAMYDPNPDETSKGPLQTLKSRLLKPILPVLFHWGSSRFFNSDAYLIRYQQEMVASGDDPLDPLGDYELMSPADVGTAAFRRWHRRRLGGRLPMARPLTPAENRGGGSVAAPSVPSTLPATREEAADPWEQHTRHCPTCRGAHDAARRVSFVSAALAVLVPALRRPGTPVGTVASVVASAALAALSLGARKFAKSFHEKGHVHGKMT